MTRTLALLVVFVGLMPVFGFTACGAGIGGALDAGLDPADCYTSMFADYTPPRVGTVEGLPSCLHEPQSLTGATQEAVTECAGPPCYSAMTYSSGPVTLSWAAYCATLTCSIRCAPSVWIFYENDVVKYTRSRTSPVEPMPY